MAGIYIHIPFCKQACYYCDFHFSTSLKKKVALVHALVKELELRKNEFSGITVETIYLGGGTPSLLTKEELEEIFQVIYSNYKISETAEITLEANPDDLSYEKIKELDQGPVNRLSIGIQSFFEEHLKAMNRAHNAKEAQACLELATHYFDNITIDLIYGIPDMTEEQWRENLDIAFGFGIPHISSYALTVESKTALETFIEKGTYPPLSEELASKHFVILMEETAKKGMEHYEISNFGKPNYFSKHNTSYWQGKPYIGIGPSAHSFNGKVRSWNVANNTKYIQALEEGKLPSEYEELSLADRFNEYIMTGLRTVWGVSLDFVSNEFGEPVLSQLLSQSQKHIDNATVIVEKGYLKTTAKGKFLCDGIASDLFMI